jgi:peroxiredoxin Q/BCP
VIGVSRDSVKSHEGFAAKHDLDFPLAADPGEEICEAYDVIRMKNMYGRQVRGIERSTFLVDRDGRIARIWRKVKVPGHAEEVLEAVKAL